VSGETPMKTEVTPVKCAPPLLNTLRLSLREFNLVNCRKRISPRLNKGKSGFNWVNRAGRTDDGGQTTEFGENQQWDDLDGCPDEIRCARHGHEFHGVKMIRINAQGHG